MDYARLLTVILILSIFGCATGNKCSIYVPTNCIGPDVQLVCEDRYGCKQCYCSAKPGRTIYPILPPVSH